jgi:mRNA interferase RelE/StbE
MSYRVWIKDEAKEEIKQLPGHMRQRVRGAIRDLSLEPRPHESQPMKSPIATELELRRLRLDRWRVIYVVDEHAQEVGVLAVRKRSPYDYSDLPSLLAGIED